MKIRQEIEKLLRGALPKINEELEKNPPTIGVIGVSGVGKSSTINTLFKTNLPTSDTVACTKNFIATDVGLTFTKGSTRGSRVQLRVIDAPGLGEDIARDPIYISMYHSNLSQCDVILWIMAARNRAVALDQMYLKEFKDYYNKMVFGVSQVDLVEPMNWNTQVNYPSVEQERNIEIIVRDRKERVQSILQRDIPLIAFSSKFGYQLQQLFTALLEATPEERSWIFRGIQGFHYTQFAPQAVRERAKQLDKNRTE